MSFTIDSLAAVKAHWSADQITGGPSDGSAVSSLPDSIAGWNLDGTSTTRPLYYATAGPNSLPSLLFDGSDDYLVTVSKSITATRPMVAVVSQAASLKNYHATFFLATASGVPAYGTAASRIQLLQYFADGSNQVAGSNGTTFQYLQTKPSVVAATTKTLNLFSFSQVDGWQDAVNGTNVQTITSSTGGVFVSLSAVTSYANFGRSGLGSSQFSGYLSEIVFWDESVLCESLYIEGSLAAKYGITLPTAHPFYSGAPSAGPSTGGSTVIVIED